MRDVTKRKKLTDSELQLRRMNRRPCCVECNTFKAEPVTGKEIYPHRPDLHDRQYWLCPCGAYVGCHRGSDYLPLGRPANKATRDARSDAHAAFDPLWKKVSSRDGIAMGHARARGYRWLAGELGISAEDCHIAMMDAATARRVTAICTAVIEAAKVPA